MDKNNLVAGIVVILLIIVALGGWFWTTIPSKEEIDRVSHPPASIDVNILKSNIAQQIQKRDKNGDIPVTVSAGEIGREDPFVNY